MLVNNASALVRGGVSWETAPDAIDVLLDVNLRGTLNCLAAVVPGMKARGLGHVVNLGSTSGTRPLPGMPVYAMTKAAIHNLGQTLRLDLHGSGRAGERDLAGPGRDRRASRPGGRSRRGPPAASTSGFECLQPADIAEAVMFVAGRAAAHGCELHGDRAHRPVLRRLAVPSQALTRRSPASSPIESAVKPIFFTIGPQRS